MNREQAKEHIRSNPQAYLRRDKKNKGYICPICGSGSGPDGTGITTKDGVHFSCWNCEYKNSDIIDIIGLEYGLKDAGEKFAKAYELYGIDLEAEGEDYKIEVKQPPAPKEPPASKVDYTDFFLQAHANINNTDYPQKRGLTAETIKRFQLGYVEAWQSPAALKKGARPPATPRLIIPTGEGSYIARDTRENLTKPESDYAKMKEGSSQLFNLKALESERPVFIVEGEIDALSIIEVGGEALALGSTANSGSLLKHLEKSKPAQPLLIALDNDKAGDSAKQRLTEGLQAQGTPFFIVDIAKGFKDANEALQANRNAFKEEIQEAEASIEAQTEAAKAAELETYLSTSAKHHISAFMDGIKDSVNTPYIPTGFRKLDAILDGGLYEGLYIIGAVSSLGKTSFTIQMADQIADQGQNILIFSLEMARSEIMAKSISRLTFKLCDNAKDAKTTRGITTGKRYPSYRPEERQLINKSIEEYSKHASNIFIHEGIGNIGAIQVRETVRKHIEITGKKPLVIIDYLQLLAPFDPRSTDKQNTDKSVLELKRLSRDFKIPVLAISSFNRQSYSQPVSMEAFKESGAIEYSSDVLIGIQAKGAGQKDFDINAAKRKDPRDLELKILKNRNGATGDTIAYEYYTLFNHFQETRGGTV